MKRIIAVLMVALMVMSAFAACAPMAGDYKGSYTVSEEKLDSVLERMGIEDTAAFDSINIGLDIDEEKFSLTAEASTASISAVVTVEGSYEETAENELSLTPEKMYAEVLGEKQEQELSDNTPLVLEYKDGKLVSEKDGLEFVKE